MPVTKSYTAQQLKSWGGIISSPSTTSAEPTDYSKNYALLNLGGNVTHGGSMPQYRLKMSRGENATTFMTAERKSVKITNGHYAVSYQPPGLQLWYWTIATGDLADSFVITDAGLTTTEADNQAKMRFVNKCLSELQSFEGQVFLGELAESLRMIKRPLSSFRKSLDNYHRDLRRRRKGSLAHKRRVIADTWLEYSYGWKPLFSDIDSGIQSLQRFSQRPVRWKPVRAGGQTSEMLDDVLIGYSVGGFGYYVEQISSFEAKVRYYGAIDLATQGLPVVTQNLGLRFDRFVPTLWELLPYSFLIDYFSNVGDIISSWSWGRSGLRWSSRGELRLSTCKRTSQQPFLFGIGPGTYNWTGRSPGQSTMECRKIDRSTYTGSFIPDFRLEIPGMSSTKWLNIAALASSRRSLRPY